MRNVIAVVIAGAVGASATWLTIHGTMFWDLWVGRLVGPVKSTTAAFILLLVLLSHISDVLHGFIGCVPAGVVAGLVATPRWRRRCGALAGAVAWSILLFIVGMQFLFANPQLVHLIISHKLVELCASVGGGLIGAIIYHKLDSKWRRGRAK